MRKLVSSSLPKLPSPEMAAAEGGVALALGGWWEEVNGSPAWQDGAFFSLSAAYALVSAVALAKNLPTGKLRIIYIAVNSFIYVIQVCIWIYLGITDNPLVELVCKIFISAISFIALLGFLIYGGRLFFMLRRFPIESKGRRKKLYEVGTVTAICFTCFLIRCIVVAVSSFDTDLSLEVLDHPILDFFYYMLTEILPSALVLFILRKLPPKRVPGQYQPIR